MTRGVDRSCRRKQSYAAPLAAADSAALLLPVIAWVVRAVQALGAGPVSAATCQQLAAAMSTPTVTAIELPASLTVDACMPDWGAGHVSIERTLRITPARGAAPVGLVVQDQAFLDYFVVTGALTFSDLAITAPASVQLTTANTFFPVILAPAAIGVVAFNACIVTLVRPDAHRFDPSGPSALPATPVAMSADLGGVPAVGGGARLLNNVYSVTGAAVSSAQVAGALVDRESFFGRQLAASGPVAGWRFEGTYVVAPTAYAGGTLVADGESFVQALNTSTVSAIYVQNSLDIGAALETQALNASTQRILVTRDLHIYGEHGVALDFRWSAEAVRVQNGATLLIDGGLVFQRMTRPTLSSLPYNFFLGVFAFETGATLRLHDCAAEHAPNLDAELWALAGATDPPVSVPTYSNTTWSSTNYTMHMQYMSRRFLSVFPNLPIAETPRIVVDPLGTNLVVQSWAVDESTWDAAIFGRQNQNGLFASYDLRNVALVAPAFSPDECDNTTGTPVTDSLSFRAALLDPNVYRLKVMKSFAINPADFPAPDNPAVGYNITRRLRVVGCESETEYTVIDTANLFRVIYAVQYASMQFKRIRFINDYQAPRRLSLEVLVGILFAADNSTLDFINCAFEGANPAIPGALLNDNFTQGVSNVQDILPNVSFKTVLLDIMTGQTSRLIPHWELVWGPFISITQGNTSAENTIRASWNYLDCVVSSKAAADQGSGGSSRTLALAIALPLAAATLCACCLAAACLLRRRRRQRAAAEAEAVRSKRTTTRKGSSGASSHNRASDRRSRSPASGSTGAVGSGPDGAQRRHRVVGERDQTSLALENKIGVALSNLGKQAFSSNAWDQIKLGKCIGTGGFSQVYKGYWRGSVVAVKVINLPEALSRSEKLKRMAVMETAISSSLSHPNIIATYTYAVRSVHEAQQRRPPGARGSSLGSAALAPADPPTLAPTASNSLTRSGPLQPSPASSPARDSSLRDSSSALPREDPRAGPPWPSTALPSTALSKSSEARPGDDTAAAPSASASAGGGDGGVDGRGGGDSGGSGSSEAGSRDLLSEDMPTMRRKRAVGATQELPTSGSLGKRSASSEAATSSSVAIDSVLSAACEVRLVQEFAPWGTLRNGLDAGRLCVNGDPKGPLDFAAVLDTAMDICKALVHLHNESVVHCDLKPSNVLLVPSSSSPKRFVAKVADFGMAQSLPTDATHVSNVWHGTMTHMAPEVLVFGQVTFASDIYALAVVMWEMVTRQPVRLNCLVSMLPFMVSARGMRPIIPDYVPPGFAALIRSCWAGDHAKRPTPQQVYHTLAQLSLEFARGALGPCALPTAADAPPVDTEFTDDRVATRLAAVGADAGMTTAEMAAHMQEAVSSLGGGSSTERAGKGGLMATSDTSRSSAAPSAWLDPTGSSRLTMASHESHLRVGSDPQPSQSSAAAPDTSSSLDTSRLAPPVRPSEDGPRLQPVSSNDGRTSDELTTSHRSSQGVLGSVSVTLDASPRLDRAASAPSSGPSSGVPVTEGPGGATSGQDESSSTAVR